MVQKEYILQKLPQCCKLPPPPLASIYPSMLYAFLPSKTDRTYERIVAVMSELVPEASPSKILLDFEQGPIKHFERGFPEAVIAL